MILSEPLLEATRDHLREKLEDVYLPQRSIRVTTDETAPPYAGEEFIGVYGSSVTNVYKPDWIVRRVDYGLTISLTRRLQGTPPDMQGEALYTYDQDIMIRTKKSMLNRAHEIIKNVDGQWELINRLKADLVDTNEDICVMTPLGFIDADSAPVEVYSEHFHIYNEEEDQGDRPVGLLLELQFGGVQTYQEKT